MKSATLAAPVFDSKSLRAVCIAALEAVENAVQKCLAAGQMLNEFKAALPHGGFLDWRAKNLPEISEDTAQRWMRGAANVANALPPVDSAIEIEASVILSTPDAELSPVALEWKQAWFDFTADKTIKECLSGVFVGGDEDHRIDRAINGKTKGGTGGDRKDFPLFVAVKLKDMGVHFSHWKGMTEAQKTEAKTAVMAAIKGDAINLRKRNFNFAVWPEEICEVALEALRARMKGTKQ